MAEIEEIPIDAEGAQESAKDIPEIVGKFQKIFQKIQRLLKKEADQPVQRTSQNRQPQRPSRNLNQKLKQRSQNMRTGPRKTRSRRHPADEQLDKSQWNWIDTLLQAKCFRFCSSSDSTRPAQGVTTTTRGSQTCDIVNGTQKENRSSCNDKQSGDGKSCYDKKAECAEAYESCGSHETERRDSETHLCPQYADATRQAGRGELAAFRARCASLK